MLYFFPRAWYYSRVGASQNLDNSPSDNGKYMTPMRHGAGLKAPEAALEGEYTFSLREVFGVLWKRLWLIGLVAILLAGVAVGISLAQTPKYEASITILVGQEAGSEAPAGSLGGEVQGLQQITQTTSMGPSSGYCN